MTQKQDLGALGEELACRYLKKKKYKIIERNHRQKWGELDIVALSPDKKLVIVEVKTASGPDPLISAEDQLTQAKLKKLKRAAEFYANSQDKVLVKEKGWQIDAIAITLIGDQAILHHYQNL